MALTDFFVDFIMQDWKSVPDGMGGLVWTAIDGVEFRAGIDMLSTSEARIAEAQGTKTVYTVITELNVTLEQGDRIKRKNDGAIFRITSNAQDMTTPEMAVVPNRQVTAERVVV